MSLKKDIISKALLNTNPGLEYRFYSGDIDTLEWLDKTKNHTSIDIIKEEIKRLQAEYDAKKYQRDRQYPSIGDQLDMIYWDKINGTEKWKESIDAVKVDHPKS
tara:strand:+ start:459 stop:770 length:312 start_codon:yes stop_codon:yes gene_type:complete